MNEPQAIVVHTTGSGPLRRYKRSPERYGSPFKAARHIYSHLMNAGPHFLIGQGKGEVVRMCFLELAAWHVGGKGARRYSREKWENRRSRWWKKRYPYLESPFGLAGGKLWTPYDGTSAPSCNANSFGIEVVPPLHDPKAPWSDDCWDSLCNVITGLSNEAGIVLNETRLLTHSCCHPRARSTWRGQPWDPRPAQFTWDLFEAEMYSRESSVTIDLE